MTADDNRLTQKAGVLPALGAVPRGVDAGKYSVSDLHFQELPGRSADAKQAVILMLHGWKGSCKDMRPLGHLLSGYYDTVLLDLPGFGKSPMHDGSWSTVEYADCVFRFIQERGYSNLVLIGHSFGARVAIRLTHSHPGLVRSVILIGAAGLQPVGLKRFKRGVKRNFNRLLKPRLVSESLCGVSKLLPTQLVTLCRQKYEQNFISQDYLTSGALRTTFVKTVTEDLSGLASDIGTPTLLLYGTDDTETPPDLGRRYARLFQNARFVALEGKNHFPHFTVGAPLCAYHVIRFVHSGPTAGQGRV